MRYFKNEKDRQEYYYINYRANGRGELLRSKLVGELGKCIDMIDFLHPTIHSSYYYDSISVEINFIYKGQLRVFKQYFSIDFIEDKALKDKDILYSAINSMIYPVIDYVVKGEIYG